MTLLRWLLYFAAFMYLGAPLIIYLTQRQNANPRLEPAGTDPSASPVLAPLAAATRAIQELGFELIGCYGLSLTANVTTFLSYLIHRGNGDLAIVAHLATPVKTVDMAEFGTRFVDGGTLTTGNSTTPGVYLRPPNKPVYRFPGERDLAKLYRYHQLLIQRDKGSQKKDVPAQGKEGERLVEALRREMNDQVPAGILQTDGQTFRPTLKGAYYMTWRLLFPVKQIRLALIASRTRALAKALEEGRLISSSMV